MGWLAVMEGANAVSNYSWGLPTHLEDTRYSDTLGWEGEGLPSTTEFAAFAKEIRPFGRLLRAATKETSPIANKPVDHEDVQVESPKEPALAVDAKQQVLWRSFTLPGFKGKLAVLVNTKVGGWCDGKSPDVLKEDDLFRIDDEGNLMDYTGYYVPRSIEARILSGEMDCVDLTSGRFVPVGEDGKISLQVRPGGGKILFLAPRGSDEIERLMKTYLPKSGDLSTGHFQNTHK